MSICEVISPLWSIIIGNWDEIVTSNCLCEYIISDVYGFCAITLHLDLIRRIKLLPHYFSEIPKLILR